MSFTITVETLDELVDFVNQFDPQRERTIRRPKSSLEDASKLMYGDAEHYSTTKDEDVLIEDMNPRYIMNVLAKFAHDLPRGADIPYEVRALAFHLWRQLAQEDLGKEF
jgi:hypothetical protein